MKLLRVLLLSLVILISVPEYAQIGFGVKKVNLLLDFAFASPKDELKNSYSYGDPMHAYYSIDVPFFYLQFSKKLPLTFNIAGFIDHEKANFEDNNYITDGLTAHFTTLGLRIRPLTMGTDAVFSGRYYQDGDVVQGATSTDQANSIADSYNNKLLANQFVKMILDGIYFDFGVSNSLLVEPPGPNISRLSKVFGYGLSPTLGGKRVTFSVDFGIRNYKWINSLKTISTVSTFHCGFGIGYTL